MREAMPRAGVPPLFGKLAIRQGDRRRRAVGGIASG
jgi:hypothetical protein